MKLVEQVKALVNVAPDIGELPVLGSATTNESILTWLMQGARHYLMALPKDLQWQYSKKVAVPENGVSTNGAVVLGASKHNRRAVQHLPENAQALRDNCSIYAPTLFTPAYWLQDGMAYVEPLGGDVHLLDAPAITQSTETFADKLPVQVDAITTNYAAMNLCTALLGSDIEGLLDELDNDDDFNLLIGAPPAFDGTAIDGVSVSTALLPSPVPTYTPPSLDAAYTDYNGVKWLERYQDDDSEMTQEVVSKIRARLEQYNLDMQNAMNAFSDDMAVWQKDIEVKLFNASQSNDIAMQKWRLKIEAYSAEVSGYSVRVNAYVNKWNARWGGWNAKAQLLQARYAWLREQYMVNLNMIGIGLGK